MSQDMLYRMTTVELPTARLQLSRQLHFRSHIRSLKKHRCPHHPTALSTYDEEELKIPIKYRDRYGEDIDELPRFSRLALKATIVLEQLRGSQLCSFR